MALFTATPDLEFATAAGLDRDDATAVKSLGSRPDREKAAQMFG